jgi:hypothetical protein
MLKLNACLSVETFTGVGTAFYAVQRFIACTRMKPGGKRVDAVHGDESPDVVNGVPTPMLGLNDD